jgi:DNA-binding NarL/FixJ family response regulator
MRPIRLLIVDDHAIVRQGLRAIIRVTPDMKLVGEAESGREAVDLAATLHPDVVLMDLVMPEPDGVAAIGQIKRNQPTVRIIALTTFAEAELVLGAVQAGADGYLLKDVDVQELTGAIRTVYRGQPYLHPEATRHLLQATARPDPPRERLTSREQEVLGLVARGLSNRQIAEVLTALSEAVDIAAAVRVFRHRHATITTWLTRAGRHSATLHQRWFRELQLPHVQLDQIRTRLRKRARGLWLWLAIDPLTKIIAVLHLGARTQVTAHVVIHALHQQLAAGCLRVFTSDGLKLYFYALTAHFGQWVTGVDRRARQWQVAAGLIYGQVKKRYRQRRLGGVTHVMRCRRWTMREVLLLPLPPAPIGGLSAQS